MDRDTFAKLLIEDGRYKQYNTKIISIYSSKELSFELFKFEDDKTEIAYQGFLIGQKVVVDKSNLLSSNEIEELRIDFKESMKQAKDLVSKSLSHNIPPPPPPPPCTGVRDDKSWFPKKPEPIEMPVIRK